MDRGRVIRTMATDVVGSLLGKKKEPMKIVIDEGYLGDDDREKPRVVYVQNVGGKKTLDLYSGTSGVEGETNKTKTIPIALSHIPPEVCECVSLERLWLSHNQLVSLPPSLPNLINLRELFLHHNELQDIPVSLCKLQNLEILWLGNNHITRVPLELKGLTSLTRLHLDNNEIEEFPEFLCDMPELRILYLNGNRVTRIPTGINNCVDLQRLYLHKNRIKRLPLDLVQLILGHSLTSVTLDDNDITELPPNFREDYVKMVGMGRAITLEGNPILPKTHHPSDPTGGLRRYSDIHRPNLQVFPSPRSPRRSPGASLSESMGSEAN